MTSELDARQIQDAGSANDLRLPYTAPELSVYNQAKITMGGLIPASQDFIGPGTNYRS